MQFGPEHECIKWFFEILREFTPAQQRAVLMFGNFRIEKKKQKFNSKISNVSATSCSRPPLLGFEYLQPPFTVARQRAEPGSTVDDDE